MDSGELVQCSTVHMETGLFILNPRFKNQLYPPLQYLGKDFHREAEECDPHIDGAHLLAILLKKRNHHPSLQIQRHSVLTADLIHPSNIPLRSYPTTLVTCAWVINESISESAANSFSAEDATVRLRRSSKCSFHCLKTSTVKGNSLCHLCCKQCERSTAVVLTPNSSET